MRKIKLFTLFYQSKEMINVKQASDSTTVPIQDPGIVPGGRRINIRRQKLRRPKRREDFNDTALPLSHDENGLEEDDIALLANAKRMSTEDDSPSVSEAEEVESGSDGDNISEIDESEGGGDVFSMPFPGTSSTSPSSSANPNPSMPTAAPSGATHGFGTINEEDDFGTDDSGSEYESGSDDGSLGTGGSSGTGGDASAVSVTSTVRSEVPKYKDVLERKQELLYNLQKLEEQGFTPSRKYTMASNVDQLAAEVKRLKHHRDSRQSVKFQRKVLLAAVSGVCLFNNKFDPIGAKLDGWDKNVAENIHDYDEIFLELYEKYQSSFKTEPEIRLLLTLGGSAFFYHVQKKLFNSSNISLDSILQERPDIKRNLEEAALNAAKTSASTPFESAAAANAQAFMNQRHAAAGAPKTQMRGPTGVDDILNSLEKNEAPRGVNIG